MKPRPHVFAAWALGAVILMLAIVLREYDGIMTIVFGSLLAALTSLVCVAVAWVAGLPLHVRAIGRIWTSARGLSLPLVGLCLGLLAFGSSLGLTAQFVDPETGRAFTSLHPAVGLPCFFLLLFTVLHWPAGEAKRLA